MHHFAALFTHNSLMRCSFSVLFSVVVVTLVFAIYIAASKEYLTRRQVIYTFRIYILSAMLPESFTQIS